MTDGTMEGQVSLFDQDIWFGKMCQGPIQAESLKEQTSKPSSQRSSASLNQMLPMFLCLKTANGKLPEASMEWEQTDFPSPWLGEPTMLNGGVFRKDGNAYVYYATSMDIQQQRYCLTLNIGEKPRTEIPTTLSEILEDNPDEKYSLSSRACEGILRRAERRGKALPKELKEALENQLDDSSELYSED